MQYGSQLDQLSGILTDIYKTKGGKPYQNWTRLKCNNYIAEVGFHRLLVRKIRSPSGPSIWVFSHHVLFFSANGARAHPGQNQVPCSCFMCKSFGDLIRINK